MPSENSLASKFGVSVGTVRKALAALTTEGMLMRRRKPARW
ncbi:GntR family transcriptional regulator (plasmid) [Pseudomonas silvicola]|nr:GntR family transcriptional regulator [Pseudomonas silvicola]